MKKYAAPVILFVLACALIVYLKVDFSGSSSSFDVNRYMQTRAKIDSLEVALWNAQGKADAQVSVQPSTADKDKTIKDDGKAVTDTPSGDSTPRKKADKPVRKKIRTLLDRLFHRK
jgi:hypothetical protein